MSRMICIAALLALCLAGPAVADEASPDASPAQQVLQKMGTYFAKAESLAVKIDMHIVIEMGQRKQTEEGHIEMAVRKPNQFRFSFTQEQQTDMTVNDGELLSTYMHELKQYTQKPADKDKPLGHPAMEVLVNKTLIADDPCKALRELGEEPKLLAPAKVGETECQVVRVQTKDGTLDLYVQAQGDPLPLRLSLHRAASPTGQGADLTVTMDYTDWKVNQPLDEKLFTFAAPEGAKKVSEFRRPEPSDMLVGKSAPDFKLESLGGKQVSLGDFKGKIVVIDFWATWCPPCRRGLPVVKKVTDEFADKAVVFYAINQREAEDKVSGYLKDKKELAGLKVLMDRQGNVANLYLVNGIPQTVIIDKQGVVRDVHVGFSPSMEQSLREQLTKLTAE